MTKHSRASTSVSVGWRAQPLRLSPLLYRGTSVLCHPLMKVNRWVPAFNALNSISPKSIPVSGLSYLLMSWDIFQFSTNNLLTNRKITAWCYKYYFSYALHLQVHSKHKHLWPSHDHILAHISFFHSTPVPSGTWWQPAIGLYYFETEILLSAN